MTRNAAILLVSMLLAGCQNAPSHATEQAPVVSAPPSESAAPDRSLFRCAGIDGSLIVSPSMAVVISNSKDPKGMLLEMMKACAQTN